MGLHRKFTAYYMLNNIFSRDHDRQRLLEENNKMLKEILSFIKKIDSTEYRDHQDFMEFLRNVAADIWVEYTEPEQRGRLFNLINKKK